MATTKQTWVDHDGLTRDGELLDTFQGSVAAFGAIIAYLYRSTDTGLCAVHNAGTIVLEMVVKGKTHEYRMPSEDDGRKKMGQLRAQAQA